VGFRAVMEVISKTVAQARVGLEKPQARQFLLQVLGDRA
jgi:hypothetical protein